MPQIYLRSVLSGPHWIPFSQQWLDCWVNSRGPQQVPERAIFTWLKLEHNRTFIRLDKHSSCIQLLHCSLQARGPRSLAFLCPFLSLPKRELVTQVSSFLLLWVLFIRGVREDYSFNSCDNPQRELLQLCWFLRAEDRQNTPPKWWAYPSLRMSVEHLKLGLETNI